MAATLLIHGCFHSHSTFKCASLEKHAAGKKSRGHGIVTETSIKKPVRRFREFRSKTLSPNDIVLTRALRAFADSGLMEKAQHLFDEMNQSDTFIWNVMIKGFTDSGMYQEAIDFYREMMFKGVEADNFTYPFVIKSCAGNFSLDEGQTVHARLVKCGFDSDVYIWNSLISMYVKLGCVPDAEKVFDEMPERDLVSWNSMISGYQILGDGFGSLMCFREMLALRIKPDRFSIVSVLNACSAECHLRTGKEIHSQVIRSGLDMHVMVQTSLLDMYSKCGAVNYAEKLFKTENFSRNTVAWNAMIDCYVQNNRFLDGFTIFRSMSGDNEKLRPDVVTLINLLPACALQEAKSLHGYAIRQGFLPHLVFETAMIGIYGERGKLESAERVFLQMNHKNLVSWNSLISAYVQNQRNESALKLFWKLCDSSIEPDSITIASILPAYAERASLSEYLQVHAHIIKSDLWSNLIISNSLIHVYAKCGDLDAARTCFDRIGLKDIVSWNTIIMAYAIHGFGSISIQLFWEMTKTGIKPNGSTFSSVLSACSISGMVDEGWNFFNSMKQEFGIDPGIEHYAYMIDLLGRAGNHGQAKKFIQEMPLTPTAAIWGSMLTASRNNNDISLAEFAADQILSVEQDNTGCYVLLSNMYAESGRWEDVGRIKTLMKNKGLSKTASCSVVETNCKTHVFFNGDKSGGITRDVLDIVSRMIGENMFIHCSSRFKPEELARQRVNSPANHSVRLAVSFGLISTAVGNPVLVRNNTRICKRCHDFMKKLSRVIMREVVVGDPKMFHHFREGICSCGDYW